LNPSRQHLLGGVVLFQRSEQMGELSDQCASAQEYVQTSLQCAQR
jgi:hypothetical protein